MLKLKPSCEHCDCDLAPDSADAMICSYECTFCANCVDTVLHNVCPNCGGGFCPRPTRPAREWRTGVSLAHHPVLSDRTHKPVDPREHNTFATAIAEVDPRDR